MRRAQGSIRLLTRVGARVWASAGGSAILDRFPRVVACLHVWLHL